MVVQTYGILWKDSIVEDMKNMYQREYQKHFDIVKDVYESKFTWGRELTFGMKYNRAVIIYHARYVKVELLYGV